MNMLVTEYSKRDFAIAIKLWVLKWRDYLGLFTWARCNHKSSYKREAGGRQEGQNQEKAKWWRKQRERDWKMLYCWCWRWSLLPNGPGAGGLWKLQNARKGFFSQSHQKKKTQTCQHLVLGLLTSKLQDKFVLFQAINFVIICYSRNKKQTLQ